MLVRISAVSCGGRAPIWVGWMPEASTRQGTSAAQFSGSEVMQPLLRTLP